MEEGGLAGADLYLLRLSLLLCLSFSPALSSPEEESEASGAPGERSDDESSDDDPDDDSEADDEDVPP